MTATFWIKALQLIASLGLLVFIHELGHFMWARLFGVRVEKFYLFFDIGLKKLGINWDGSIFKFKPKNSDTEYGMGWMPLGGYCKIAGMIDESMDLEQMQQPEQPWEFRTKPAWQRLLIMIGGVLNNFLLAIIIYAGIVYYWGEQYIPYQNATLGMTFSDSAHKLGFMEGDIPLTADGKQLNYLNSDEIQAIVTARQVKVLRGGKDTVAINIPSNYIFTANKEAEAGIPFIDYRIPVVVDVENKTTIYPKSTDLFKSQYRVSAPDWDDNGKTLTFEFNERGHKTYRVLEMDLQGNVKTLIEEKNAVSEEVAREMVKGVIDLMEADYAIATTGFAGPGADPGFKVGTIWIAYGSKDDIRTLLIEEDEGREENLRNATFKALQLFVEYLKEIYPDPTDFDTIPKPGDNLD